MTAEVDRYRWKVEDDQFAASFVVDDFPGFFRQDVIVEPGTRALLVADGQFIGEVPPGTYTLKGMRDKLKFLTTKQATVILTRQEDFPLQTPSSRIANTKPLLVSTKESLSVSASIRVTVQIDDVAMFHRNLMGANIVYTTLNLEEHLRPLLQQSLWESVSRFSITELTTPEVREQMDAAMEHALSVSLKRYGLRFIQVQLVAIRHKEYEHHREKDGQRWLHKADLEQREADNDLEILAENIEIDHHEAKLETKKRRIGLQNELLEAVRSKAFDQVAHKEELANFLQERNKGKLLRKEELDELVEGYDNRKDDREAARQHLLATLSLQRRYDQEALRDDLRHALRLKRLEHEISLTEQVESKDNLLWRQQVDKDRREAEHRYELHDKKLTQRRIWIVQEAEHKREDQWEDLIHQDRVQQQEDEMEFARAER
ncbi:MAG: SPFH domain-containing protein, partial [Rubripirellula sp.]|nr:SPFH domain-containing protein [Rubripirellula sp.]